MGWKGFLCTAVLRIRIRDPVPFLTPVSGIGDPGWVKNRILDEQHGSYFRELRNQFFGLKYLNYLMWIQDPGSGMENIRTRDKHPGSAALLCRIEISVGSALLVAGFGFAFKIAL